MPRIRGTNLDRQVSAEKCAEDGRNLAAQIYLEDHTRSRMGPVFDDPAILEKMTGEEENRRKPRRKIGVREKESTGIGGD